MDLRILLIFGVILVTVVASNTTTTETQTETESEIQITTKSSQDGASNMKISLLFIASSFILMKLFN
ncbi:hypothetical protein LSH36_90g04024 [Paralvinella palmiformis]|uniref:Uncharacterized protein n=1 Tax=Paralvinella palmiformis TaxID=53620 RepID=A0AAD9ND65_9ANNE|nr:hypothetical protein LSH36_90g04024 [Paralvinella palmiformis]